MRVLPWIRLLAVPAAALLAASCTDVTQPTQPGPAVQFLIVSGNNQSGIAGQELPAPIRIRALDDNAVPVPNTVVNFVVTAGGGSVFAGASITDANGYAADIWRLGSVAGTAQTLEVRSVGPTGVKFVHGVFTATAGNSAPTTIVKFEGDGQSAAVGTAVAVAPAVKITDQLGNPVSGESVTFAVASGGGGITGANAVTDGSGIARVGSWTLGATAGPNTLTATAAALPGSPLTFSATGTGGGGGPGSLTIATAPSTSAQNDIVFAVQPAIQLRDEFGAPLAQSGIQITASVSGGGAGASGTTTSLTDGTGKATFTGLSLTGVVGSYVVTFSASGFASVNSASINLAAGAAASIAVVDGNAQSANAGTAVPIRPSVRVTDISGNPVQGVSVTFAVTQGGGSASGPAQTTGVDGIATVGGWTLGPLSGPNGLDATAAGVGSPAGFTATALGNFWASIANVPVARRYSASAVLNGILYLAGGRNSGGGAINTFHAYNPTTNTWSTQTHSIASRVGAAMVPLNGKLYLMGGSTGSGAQLNTLGTMEVYDPATNAWTFVAPMPEARDFFAAGVVNGIIYVTGGGAKGQGIRSTTYSYDPATNVWTQRASLPAARSDISGVGANGLFYVVGGTAAGTNVDGRILSYDPQTDSWTTLAAMSTRRTHVNAELVNGLIYAISGMANGMNPASPVVEAYDPATNTWGPRASMLASRYGSGLGFIGGRLYVAGGYNGSATLATAEKYAP